MHKIKFRDHYIKGVLDVGLSGIDPETMLQFIRSYLPLGPLTCITRWFAKYLILRDFRKQFGKDNVVEDIDE